MKKWLSVAVALACCIVLTGCISRDIQHSEEAEPKLVMGFSQLGSESSWRLGCTQSIIEAAESHDVTLMFENAYQNQEKQIDALRSFISYRVDVICFSPIVEDGWENVLQEAKKAGIPIKTYADGDTFMVGSATVEVWKLEGTSHEMNDCSAQMKVTFGERTMLLTADLEENGQKKMVELHGDALDADIIKYPHHGIEELVSEYQAAVTPLFLVITNNHRKTAGWKWITSGKAGVPYAYTVPDLVHLTTDGTTWIAEKIPSAVKY